VDDPLGPPELLRFGELGCLAGCNLFGRETAALEKTGKTGFAGSSDDEDPLDALIPASFKEERNFEDDKGITLRLEALDVLKNPLTDQGVEEPFQPGSALGVVKDQSAQSAPIEMPCRAGLGKLLAQKALEFLGDLVGEAIGIDHRDASLVEQSPYGTLPTADTAREPDNTSMRCLGHLSHDLPFPSQGYLVGGAVRDWLLGRRPRDLDFVVPHPAAEAQALADRLGERSFLWDPERSYWRVVAPGWTVDVAPLRGSLAEELARRDYTVNALALSARGALLGSPLALADLASFRLRLQGRERLIEDPLRALRGPRLAVELRFRLEPQTLKLLSEELLTFKAHLPAWERIGTELAALMRTRGAPRGWRLLAELGYLRVVLPELAATQGVLQGGRHHLEVFEHSLACLAELLELDPQAPEPLRWAALLHDVGKPMTQSRDERGIHFYGHARLGAQLVREALGRLRMGHDLAERVAELIARHMDPFPEGERLQRRWFLRHRDLLPDLLYLEWADVRAQRGQEAQAMEERLREGLKRWQAQAAPSPRLLNGHEVMALLGLPPGPEVGRALRLLEEAQALGELNDPMEARSFLLAKYRPREPS
jgi:poly(A) polymerase